MRAWWYTQSPMAMRGSRGGAAAFSGQGYLDQVAHATGADAHCTRGRFNPVSLTPFLNEFQGGPGGELYGAVPGECEPGEGTYADTRIKLTTTQPKVKIHAPENVHRRRRLCNFHDELMRDCRVTLPGSFHLSREEME